MQNTIQTIKNIEHDIVEMQGRGQREKLSAMHENKVTTDLTVC